jgi:hypothetical protein
MIRVGCCMSQRDINPDSGKSLIFTGSYLSSLIILSLLGLGCGSRIVRGVGRRRGQWWGYLSMVIKCVATGVGTDNYLLCSLKLIKSSLIWQLELASVLTPYFWELKEAMVPKSNS